ncbi:leucine-rich repeat neuronal protein 1-like isoform X2 [Sycon ciliatum]|uniref:leucine-rich repeat neuronal protein 1-like isoform X2 n=1 Tax=Sycon ciliatum TaxID=27933 RepID=UPI0031F5F12A
MVLEFKMSIHTVLSLVICYYVLTGTTVMSCPASCTCAGAPWYTVNCQYRRLTMVPGGIPNTTITLFLDINQIQNLSDGVFSGLPNLRELYLYNNQIQNLSDGVFSGLTNLQRLDLDNNQIQTLSNGVFTGLTNLTTLYLNNNQIQTLSDGVFTGLTNLQYLHLYNNQIQTLSGGVFSGLTNLQGLNLYNNQIQTLSGGVFSGLTNLQGLRLDSNQIQTLSDGVFSGLTNLQYLWLSGNPLILKPSLYVNLYGIGTISTNSCYGCVILDSQVAVYLNQVSKSCAPGHFQKFNNNGSVDYYCRCNESVPVITPNCSSPGYTCLANGQFPICFGYTKCQKAGSTYMCTCEEELSLNQSNCYIAEDCQNTVEDCGNGNCTMDYSPESRINSEFNEPSSPLGGAYSTINVTIHGGNIVIQCQPYFDRNIDAINSTVQCLSHGNWTTLRATPCSRASVAPLTTGKPTRLIPTIQRTMSTTVAPTTPTPTNTSASPTTSGISSGTSAVIQTSSSYRLGTVIGAGIGGMVFGILATTLVAVIVYRKLQGKPVQTEVPSQTQNAAYEEANIAESSLTKSDAYGVVESSPQPQYEFICPQ